MYKSVVTKPQQIFCRARFISRGFRSLKILPAPTKIAPQDSKVSPPVTIDEATIKLLERLSLVGFENEKGVKIVEDAIRFADQIFEVDTENVEPLFTVLEDESLHLREDVVNNDVTTKELLSNAKVFFENYYITPVGNIEYVSKPKLEKQELPKEKPTSEKEKIL